MAKIIDPDDLTYIVNGTPAGENIQINTTAKTIKLVAGGSLVAIDGVTGQCLFSKLKEVIKASAALISVPLPIREMIHDESMELINGWTMADSTSLKMIRDCGLAYVNAAGAITAMFACMTTLGALAAGTTTELYFVQDSSTSASTATFTHVNTGTTFGVNELIQIYRDDDGDGNTSEGSDFDRRSYYKIFLRREGYTSDESSNADIGYETLTYKKYNFPITHTVDAGVTVDDATLAGYTGMSITWYAAAQSASLGANGPYNYHVIIDANGHTYDEVYSWVQYQLRQTSDIDAGAGNRTGAVAPALVRMDGSTLKTILQTSGGVHVANLAAGSYNNIAEADDTGALRTYPLSVTITCEFDSFLVGDADSYFWVFEAADYGTPGATPLQDATPADVKGAATTSPQTFAYTYSTDVAVKGIALGKSGAKIAEAEGTITNTGVKLVFVAGLERWYSNPA